MLIIIISAFYIIIQILLLLFQSNIYIITETTNIPTILEKPN